jgi:AcrR family transcriptional regulator
MALRVKRVEGRQRKVNGHSQAAFDGRHRRAARNRERIIDAVAEALADPEVPLTPAGVATRAGVSISTIVRHFRNREGLVAALRERIANQVLPLLTAGPIVGPLEERVSELVRRRSAIFELVAPAYRAAPRAPGVTDGVEARGERRRLEQVLGAQLRQALETEVAGDGELAALLDAVLSFPSWDQLRTAQGLDAEHARKLLERGTLALLSAPRP